jgi:hypothetical protein
VKVVAFWDEVAVLTRYREFISHALFQGDKGVGSPANPVNRRDKNVRVWFMTPVRFFLCILDALGLRAAFRRIRNSGADVIIFDRYIYDEIANLKLGNRTTEAFVKLILKLVPRPDLAYLLDADPLVARARKPEYPVEFLQINRESYLGLCKIEPQIAVIRAPSLAETTSAVERELWRRFSSLTDSEILFSPSIAP